MVLLLKISQKIVRKTARRLDPGIAIRRTQMHHQLRPTSSGAENLFNRMESFRMVGNGLATISRAPPEQG
jgi:hypothetical protein